MIALYFSSGFEIKPLCELVPHVNTNNVPFTFSKIYKIISLYMTILSNIATVECFFSELKKTCTAQHNHNTGSVRLE